MADKPTITESEMEERAEKATNTLINILLDLGITPENPEEKEKWLKESKKYFKKVAIERIKENFNVVPD